jgi:predicted homoserine dehydrogenase-like protein
VIYQQMFDRVREPEVVRAALIGSGNFGTPIVTQARLIPRLELRVVADRNMEAARSAFLSIGVEEDDIAICDSPKAALRAVEAGKWLVAEDAMILMDLPLHVIVTATGVPEAGARYAYEAIRHGKHVVFVDKEADSVVGPMLKHLADRAGVVFTTDDGDQPGLVMGMVSWARVLGFEVLCGGNLHELRYSPKEGAFSIPWGRGSLAVPSESRWALERIPEGQAPRYMEARRRLTADWEAFGQDGDSLAHMAVTANGTGLAPDTPGTHLPLARLEELPEILCPEEDGGILRTRGAVEMVTVLRTDGMPSVDGGIFVIVSNADRRSREIMITKGLMTNRRGSAMLIYRAHHLCGAETAVSILCAGLLRVPTGASTLLPVADITVTANRDFNAGEVISGPGKSGADPDLRPTLIPATPVADDSPLPFFMLEGNRLATDWPKGTILTRRMVVAPADSALWSLRQQQDEVFPSRK